MTARETTVEKIGEEMEMMARRIARAWEEALNLEEAAELARALCPADTGALRASIRVERVGQNAAALVAGGAAYVNPKTGRPVDYAAAVHDGTSRTPPRPFLSQAIDLTKNSVTAQALEASR